MAALMRLRIDPIEGDAYEVNVTPAVIVATERQFTKPMTEIFGETASFEALCWVAWRATQSTGRVVKPFDEWLEGIEAVEGIEEPRVPLGSR